MADEANNWIWFADGHTCTFIEKFEMVDEKEGTKIVKFLLRPSDPMKAEYDIADRIDHGTGFMIVTFPKTEVEVLVSMPGKNRVFIFQTITNGKTNFSERYEVLSTKIQLQQKLIQSLQVENASLMARYKQLSERQTEALRASRKMFEEANKVRGKIKKDNEDEDEEET